MTSRLSRLSALVAALLPSLVQTASADVINNAGVNQLAADAAAVGVVANAVALPVDPVGAGQWTPLIPWTPHIPVSAANLPDGRLLTWAGDGRRTWDGGDSRRSFAAVWDPRTGQFREINNTRHDMFCAGLTVMPDGRVFVNGGDACNAISSIFDWRTNEWTALPAMNDTRWYNPSVSLPDGSIFTVTGSGTGANTAERWDSATGWRRLTGIPWQNVLAEGGFQNNWHPFVTLAPDGRLLHFGPTRNFHWITASGAGSLVRANVTLPGTYFPKEGAYAMYEEGRILVAGGFANNSGRSFATRTNQAIIVDLNPSTPSVASTSSMTFPRFFSNSVVLPNGEVMVIGGNTGGVPFSDADPVLTPEIWNPRTGRWRTVANIAVPRAYHSTALLLADGRVWSGGGGLNGGDHQDAQIYTPPALLRADGSPAVRPVISGGASTIGYGQTFEINATPGLAQFAIIRTSSLTHSVNTDLRRLVVPFTEVRPGTYRLASHPNRNVMTPGYWMLFAIDPQGVYSEARTLFVTTANTPTLTTPADQLTTVNTAVDLALNGFAPSGTPVYSATGLPPGLQINATTGRITGTATTQGGYRPTVTITAANQAASATFGWTVVLPNLGTGTILRELWAGIAGNPVANLTSNLAYPGRATATSSLTSFNAPANSADNYGQRVRGYLHAPVSGTYRFYIAADDSAQLLLSSNDQPIRAGVIASVSAATLPQEWNRFPEQASVAIQLEAGQRYYIEAISKEGVGDDHLAVGWTLPGATSIAVVPGAYLSPFQIPETVIREVYTGITGVTIASLTGNANFPARPNTTGRLTHFEAPADVLDNYGQRLRSWVTAPVTGQYRFYICSDDNGQLSLSTDANPANARVIATMPVWSSPRNWTAFPQQASALITLQAGQRYYIEALMKEGGGGDNLAVGWTIPGTSDIRLLSSEFLSLAQPPTLAAPGAPSHAVGEVVSVPFTAAANSGGALSYSATGLPPGITLAPNAPVFSGTPTQAGVYNVSLTVNEAGGLATTATFSWTIRQVLALPVLSGGPQPAGNSIALSITGTGGTNPRYSWNFGDGSPDSPWSSSGNVSHTFPGPGRYIVTVTATDDTGRVVSSSFWQVIHAPLTAARPVASSALALVPAATGNARLWVANPDADTVSILDAVTGARLNEIAVGASPRCVALAPDGRVWVTCADAGTISVLDPVTATVAQTLPLPRGSRPFGLVFAPDGRTAAVVLEATGQLLLLNPTTGATLRTVAVGPNPRHVSMTADSARLLVSRFITPHLPGEDTASVDTTGRGGEVVVIAAATGTIEKTAVLQHSEAIESQSSARGIPNYLGAAVISPDGTNAWVPSKQDNIKRGALREGSELTHDGTIRAIVSKLALPTVTETYSARVDIDNSGVPSAAAFDPFGGYLFVALEANRQIAIVDALNAQVITHFTVGRAPQAVLLSADGRTLYVQNFMDRTVSIYDVTLFLQGRIGTPALLATTNTVAAEKLSAQVLRGKQLFYDAADGRLALEGYISCASCHNDGGHDGRTWDFTGFGEGLRNTPTLKGHGATLPPHWTGNFDEIQDFENQIRNFARGSGLIEDGTPNPPLGAPNAGRSSDLDALAAYVTSLTTHPASPAAAESAEALAGRAVFIRQNCTACHNGAQLTNSALGVFADIGTIKPGSGRRLGAAITGFDVPTLRGLWNTAPYLHDGSAATLDAAIAAHRGLNVTATERANLVAFLLTLDDSVPSPVNTAPTITSPLAQTSARGATVSLPIVASDVDGQPLTYSASGLPDGLQIDATTGVISGTILGSGAATNNVTITVNDGAASVSASFTWSLTIGVLSQLAEDFGDTPLDPNLWELGSLYVPLTGSFDQQVQIARSNGRLAITPRTGIDGSSYNGIITRWAFDLRGSAVTADVSPAAGDSLTWLALGRGRDFLLIAVTGGSIFMEQTVNGVSDFTGVNYDPVAHRFWRIRHVPATDEIVFEGGSDENTWTELRRLPRAISIDALRIELVAGTYFATPAPGEASFDRIRYIANRRPEITVPVAQTTVVGTAVNLAIRGSDADGQTVRYTASGLPAGLSIDVVSGVISGTVGVEAARNNEVTVSVSDGLLSRSGSFGWTVLPASTLGAEWTSQEIGGGAVAGGASFGGGVYTLRSAGLGVVLGGDQFQYVWQQWSGDGELVARVTSQTATDPAARAGLIFRESLSGTSRFGAVFLTPSRGYVHEFRQVSGGPTGFTLAARNAAPNNWLRLIRSGDTVTSFRSVDGVTWTQIASGRVVMSRGLTAGLIVSSKAAGQVSTATMDNVRFTPSTVPAPWVGGDIGAPARTELESFANGVFTVRGGGAGITGTADHGHFTSQVLSGNGQITARVVSQSNTFTWAKAGVMIRESVASNARMALATVTQGQGVFFQARTSVGGAATAVAAPRGNTWVRLVRNGNTITAWRSGDGVTWTALGTTQIAFGPTVSFGLAVTASGANLLSTAVFDNVTVTPLP